MDYNKKCREGMAWVPGARQGEKSMKNPSSKSYSIRWFAKVYPDRKSTWPVKPITFDIISATWEGVEKRADEILPGWTKLAEIKHEPVLV